MKLYILIGLMLGGIIGGWLGSLIGHGNTHDAWYLLYNTAGHGRLSHTSGWSFLFATIGSLIGVWAGYKFGKNYG